MAMETATERAVLPERMSDVARAYKAGLERDLPAAIIAAANGLRLDQILEAFRLAGASDAALKPLVDIMTGYAMLRAEYQIDESCELLPDGAIVRPAAETPDKS